MYRKIDSLNLPKVEKEILELWKEQNIKEKSLNNNKEKGKVFSFFEGPPTANGTPHTGHVLTRSLKDLFTRAKVMEGYYVPRKGGWDTHGLPVELSVEKQIGISGKEQVEKFGVQKFVVECKKDVWKYANLWKEFSEKVAYGVNMEDDCYVTYENNYIESVWWSLKELDKKGLLYKGYKIMPSCPSCGTGLSSHEVAQGYKDKTDLTAVVKFALCEEENTYFLAWTTTPWTLPSNVALCVNPNEEYVKIKFKDEKYILAKALLSKHFTEDFEILQTVKGADLEKIKYQPLFDFVDEQTKEKSFFVTCADFVTLTDGTGIVHIAPAYGEDDSKVGMNYDLPFVQNAKSNGRFKENCGKYANLNIFDENENIVKDLKTQNKIFKAEKHTHSYPHCWRCSTPLMYFARDSWYVKTTAIKDKLIKNNQSVNWLPETIKNGRMGNWLENVVDWGISRDRYWGTPLPVWKCECGHYHVVGSIKELKELTGCDDTIELHKPYVDNLFIKCEKCNKQMRREKEVVDCWYDSGSMPFAQFHYPFENKEEFEKRFPADFIAEGMDQCRGWFYSMQVLGTALFGKSPYKNVIVNGMVVDEQGRKLSKSLGNYTPPIDLIEEVGADVVRWSFYSQNQPWSNMIMTNNTCKETTRNYFGTLHNTFAFFVLYADIDKFNPSEHKLENCKLSVMDKWILSELNVLINEVRSDLKLFKGTEPSRKMQKFIDNLSNWYVRRCRKRFWVGGFTEDKKSAYMTLWTVLTNYAKLSAPFTPFYSEYIYQNLIVPFFKNAKESVHLCGFPKFEEEKVDEKLSKDMDLTYNFTELGRSARNAFNLKIRQPLSTMFCKDAQSKLNLKEDFIKILKEELNVKNIEQNSNIDEFISYTLKPQLKTLGPKYGKLLGGIRNFLSNCNADEVVKTVKNTGIFKTEINGEEVCFSEEDLLITVAQKEGFASSVEDNYAVVFDTTLTKELINEGNAREFVSKIQTLRKSSNLEVTDRIEIFISGDDDMVETLISMKESICQDVLAVSMEKASKGQFVETFDLNGKQVKTGISKK